MRDRLLLALGAAGLLISATAQGDPRHGIGRPATPAEIAGWNIDVAPDGKGLPPGHGSVADGARLFAETCSACHGERGEQGDGRPIDPLVGGRGSLATDKPVRTVGSYWPYATTLFDYIRRAMPFNAPGSLSSDQAYAAAAYILYLNGIVPDGTVLDAKTLPAIQMPNRDGFKAMGNTSATQ
jgi:S-disulfanyl-L-cysteine oxidoreductase SoxD